MVNVKQWNDIKEDFLDSLILGNGASAATDSRFLYSSLFSVASDFGFITPRVQQIFDYLDTKDFEFVLRSIATAQYINRSLEISETITAVAYDSVREALVKAVREVHTSYDNAVNYLPSLASYMKRFNTVVSLNYDLLVYWAMLKGNSDWQQTWFKDCFISGRFQDDFEFLRQPRGQATGATLLFYPHGNLVLATDIFGQEKKISNDTNAYLLDTIMADWETGEYTPLFVSEGTNTQKLQAIRRNGYLRTVYNSVLPNLGKSLVVYGWSMSEQDAHILNALGQGEIQKLAVSVYLQADGWEEYCEQVQRRVRQTRGLSTTQIVFFDSESDGCWKKTSTDSNDDT